MVGQYIGHGTNGSTNLGHVGHGSVPVTY